MIESSRISDNKGKKNAKNISILKRKQEFSQHSGSLENRVLFLQRTIGNQAVDRLIRSGILHAGFRIRNPGNVAEHEAHKVQKISCKTPEIKPKLTENVLAPISGGQYLSDSEREFFEPRFGHDFSRVRLHLNESTETIGALAYTIGNHIVFGKSQYSPHTIDGKGLLAHELTHVIQQRSAPSKVQCKSFGETDDPLEIEADRIGNSILENNQVHVGLMAPAKKPQFGIVGCLWYMWRFSHLLDECRNEYNEACTDDLLSDECQEFMHGAGFPSDAILQCVGRKNPRAMAKLLSSCSTVSLGQILRGPRASIERLRGPPLEDVGEEKEPETSVT